MKQGQTRTASTSLLGKYKYRVACGKNNIYTQYNTCILGAAKCKKGRPRK